MSKIDIVFVFRKLLRERSREQLITDKNKSKYLNRHYFKYLTHFNIFFSSILKVITYVPILQLKNKWSSEELSNLRKII